MLSPAENMDLVRQLWAAQAARNAKATPVWLVITEAGELRHWAMVRRTAAKAARKCVETCYVARLDPRET